MSTTIDPIFFLSGIARGRHSGENRNPRKQMRLRDYDYSVISP